MTAPTLPSRDYTIPVVLAIVSLVIVGITASTFALIFAPTSAPVVALVTGMLTLVVPLLFGLIKIQELHRAVNGLNAATTNLAERDMGATALEIGGRMDPLNRESVAAAKAEVEAATDASAAQRVATMAAATGDPVAGVATGPETPKSG